MKQTTLLLQFCRSRQGILERHPIFVLADWIVQQVRCLVCQSSTGYEPSVVKGKEWSGLTYRRTLVLRCKR